MKRCTIFHQEKNETPLKTKKLFGAWTGRMGVIRYHCLTIQTDASVRDMRSVHEVGAKGWQKVPESCQ